MVETRNANWQIYLATFILGLLLSCVALGPAAAQTPGDVGYGEMLEKEALEKPDRPEFSGAIGNLQPVCLPRFWLEQGQGGLPAFHDRELQGLLRNPMGQLCYQRT